MEQTTHAPGQLRRILPGVLLAAGLVWLMTGLFAPLTLGLLLAALMAPMAEALSRHTGCPRRLAAVGTMALFYLLLGLALTAAGSWAAGQGAQLLRQLPRLRNSSLLPALGRLVFFYFTQFPPILQEAPGGFPALGAENLWKTVEDLPYASFPARTAMSSAAMETAISSGVSAPMARPMGAWTRAYSASVKPSARRRSLQRASFRREPMQPR